MPFLLPNQQHQSIEGTNNSSKALIISNYDYNGGITEVDMVKQRRNGPRPLRDDDDDDDV